MEGVNGVVSIADDVCVHGRNAADHDVNLTNLMKRAAEKGIVFNSDKCFIKQRISLVLRQYVHSRRYQARSRERTIHPENASSASRTKRDSLA